MPRIFISRSLKPDSPFLKLGPRWGIEGQSLLQFEQVDLVDLPDVDWFFFYSRRGVSYLLAQFDSFAHIKLACLGQAAATALKEHQLVPDFVGNGDPSDTAQQWLPNVSGLRVGFVQARHSRASVQHILEDKIKTVPIIVYDNKIRADITVQPADYLVFTSPLNFQAYTQHYELADRQRIIGIGATTAVTFSNASVKEYRIAQKPSEASLVECLLEWEGEQPVAKATE